MLFNTQQTAEKSDIGVAYRDLNVYGFGTPTDYQKTFTDYPLAYLVRALRLFRRQQTTKFDKVGTQKGWSKVEKCLLCLVDWAAAVRHC